MVGTSIRAGSPGNGGARERILDTAYDLFSQRGVRGVGIDEVVERSGVAKATLYRHFPAKDDLVVAFLELREERWSRGLEMEAKRRGATAEDQLFAIFDVFDEWFRRDDFEACSLSTRSSSSGRNTRRVAPQPSTSRTSDRSCASWPRPRGYATPQALRTRCNS